jgi:poly(glycerol-phosphate) alpha-glucosyltransferase
MIPTATAASSHPHRFPHRGLLPEGRYYTLTWAIGYDFGGMTTVALERSSAFARLDNRRVDILTLGPEMKDRGREGELRDGGLIDRRVSVRNLWQDLTSWSDRKLRRMVGTIDPDTSAADDVLKRTGREWSEQRQDSEGRLLQADRYHDRGHLLVIDRQDMKKRGRRGGRQITLFDREQRVVAQWATAREFYQAWLDVVIGSKPSYLICDSAFVGNFIHGYRRENIILSQVIHSHHLNDADGDGFGALSGDKFGLLSHLDAFDLVTTLTDAQREDLDSLNLSSHKIRTVSNFTGDMGGAPGQRRPRGRGAMIARLVETKRVDDAIAAIAIAADSAPSLTLDVYGDGDERTKLTEAIESSGLDDVVVLHGHTTGAKSHFRSSSLSLLTSRSEGQGLVVLESMSAGCVPICYAVDYGPADIIDHGVNGFLVPPGDIGALAATIREFLAMPEAAVEAMREKAIARAADFYEEPIVRRWGRFLAEQEFSPISRLSEMRAELQKAEANSDGITITARLSNIGESTPRYTYVSWRSRTGNFYGRVRANLVGDAIDAEIPIARLENISEEFVDFSIDLVADRAFCRARIASVDDAIVNGNENLSLYATKHGNLSSRNKTRTQIDVTDERTGRTSTP